MNDYTDSAVALLAAAVNRRRNARPDELIEEVWKLYDMAEGFAEALQMLDLDEGKFHPYTVRGARIVSVSEDKGLQVSWLEPDRDTGAMVPNDAYVGSTYHAWQRAALRNAKAIAGTDQLCSIYISYEKQDGTYTNSTGQAISWIRRVLRIQPYGQAPERRPQDAPAGEERAVAPHTPDPARSAPAAPPAEHPAVAAALGAVDLVREHVERQDAAPGPQRTLAEAEPPPADDRPADPALVAIAQRLTDDELIDPTAPLRPDILNAYRLEWWNKLPRGTEPRLRALNKAALPLGRGLRSPNNPATTDDLLRVVDLTRDLLAEQGATAL